MHKYERAIRAFIYTFVYIGDAFLQFVEMLQNLESGENMND